MECFNCGALLTGKDFCEKCGVDVKIYKKIIIKKFIIQKGYLFCLKVSLILSYKIYRNY